MSRLALFFPALLVACSAGRDDAVSAPLGDASTDDGSLGDVSLDDGGSTLDVLLDEDGGGSPPTCKGLQCQQVKCPDGTTTTTITGTVFNPAKTDPLYNAVVYVPNAPVDAFKPGVTCEKCGVASGEPIVSALSGSDGKFRLENVPVGDNIPLVIQIGRWRRQVVIPKIEACTNNAVGPDLTRLPKNQKEGDIPLTAIVTSTYDPTECILRKIGIDDSEFTVNTGKGRIHIYHGNGETLGASTPAGAALWGDLATLKKYDLVAFPCSSVATDAPSKQNVVNYADAGGRVFATDLSYPWVDASAPTPWNGAATWGSGRPRTRSRSTPRSPRGRRSPSGCRRSARRRPSGRSTSPARSRARRACSARRSAGSATAPRCSTSRSTHRSASRPNRNAGASSTRASTSRRAAARARSRRAAPRRR
ncbi:MAG: hypothetical protein IPJ34_00595 [Myxococcales bacterium]|nr:hypothetical protein [Myxococcales bacterium]